ncbi:MAG: hypothetical protein GX946_01045 [Oligosphaeraceae bacterium]|nr:hypothetical protein [Oligosphaeraceae bacterium]
MNKSVFFFSILFSTLCTLCGAELPQHEWQFLKSVGKEGNLDRFTDSGYATTKRPFFGMSLPDGTQGITGRGPLQPYGFIPMDFPEYTIEMRFRLDKQFVRGKSRGLFNYDFWSWNRRTFRFRIDPEGRVECRFNVSRETENPLKFTMVSPAQEWETGIWYTIRVAGKKGEVIKVYLNGKAIAARENAPGLDEINDGKTYEQNYFVRLGWDTTVPTMPHGELFGAIQYLKIWNVFLAPSLTDISVTQAPSERGENESANVSSQSRTRHLVIGEDQELTSARFYVPDLAGHAVGHIVSADKKFVDNAATGSITSVGENFVVKCYCPIPEGMTASRDGQGVWDGDFLEFFIRPRSNDSVYYQYCAGTNGASRTYRYPSRGSSDPNFKSQAKFSVDLSDPSRFIITIVIPKKEVECDRLEPGDVITGNFIRGGATSGGTTYWSPMTSDFHAVDLYGTMIYGSAKAYFLKGANQLAAKAEHSKGNSKRRKEFEQAFAAFRTDCDRFGDNPLYFENLTQALNNLRDQLLSYTLSGKSALLWQNDTWSNEMSPSMLSRPLTAIKLRAAQNSKVLYGMTFSNLSGRPFLGLAKCFQKWPLQSANKCFYTEPWNDFLDHIQILEGIMLQSSGGNPLYDPMIELPQKNILRAAPHDNIPLWLSISTKGLNAGKYTCILIIKPSYPDFELIQVPVELEVLPIDLSAVETDSYHYSFFTELPINNPTYRNIEHFYRYLVERDTNVMFAGHLREVYPPQNPDGTLHPIDFTVLDRKIDTYLKAGMSPDRLKLMFNLHTFIFIWIDKDGKDHSPTLKFGTPEFEKGFKEFMRQFYAHLQQKYKLPPERVIIYTGDEPEGDINDPKSRLYRVNYLARLVKTAVPNASCATNPYPRQGVNAQFIEAINQLCKYHNILIFVTGAKKKELVEVMTAKKGITLWTYGVFANSVAPEIYRQMYTQSFREGFGSANAFWSIDSYSGDGFDQSDFGGNWEGGYSKSRTDYGATYCDMNLGTIATGRRAEANFQGLLDYKAMLLCRQMAQESKNPTENLKQLDEITTRAMRGSCLQMDQCHQELLDLIMKMKNEK